MTIVSSVDFEKIDFGFERHTLEEHTQALSNLYPSGGIFRTKNIDESVFRQIIEALAIEFKRQEDAIADFVEELDPATTTLLIDEWEKELGIPDGCFPGTGTIEERRRDVIVKIGLSGINTREDYIDLAELYGFDITIENPAINDAPFPWTFPHTFGSNGKEEKFTIIVRFVGFNNPSSFPITFPWVFSDARDSNIITCLIERLVPINVKVEYLFEPVINPLVDEFGNPIVDEFGNSIVEKVF